MQQNSLKLPRHRVFSFDQRSIQQLMTSVERYMTSVTYVQQFNLHYLRNRFNMFIYRPNWLECLGVALFLIGSS